MNCRMVLRSSYPNIGDDGKMELFFEYSFCMRIVSTGSSMLQSRFPSFHTTLLKSFTMGNLVLQAAAFQHWTLVALVVFVF